MKIEILIDLKKKKKKKKKKSKICIKKKDV